MPFDCLFDRGFFLATRVAVSLTVDSAVAHYLHDTKRASLQPAPESFLFLPMAAAANGSSFPPHALQASIRYMKRHTSHITSHFLQKTGISSIQLDLLEQHEQMAESDPPGPGAGVASVVVFGIGQ